MASPLAGSAAAANCAETSTGNTPLNDLGTGTYQGYPGGLYPDGSNSRPPAHDARGLLLAEGIQPMKADGMPDPNGKYVLLSIGMSNASIEFQAFLPLANSDPSKDAHLAIVDGGASGADASSIADPAAPYWNGVDERLTDAGVTGQQVAVVWVKEAIAHPTTEFPQYSQDLQGNLTAISRILHQRFPNLRLAYYSSRTYGGYATTDLNPEPYAYWSGFADKWLIEDQIAGDPALNYDPAMGSVEAPWMSWGPYLWADGLAPRRDGLTWSCGDFREDGTHPSNVGANKVANMLLDFFRTDSTAREWFLASPAGSLNADLSLTDTASPDPLFAGDDLTYTLTVANAGPDPATGVTLTDTLPAGELFESATPSQGTCSESSGTVTCTVGILVGSEVNASVTIVAAPTAAAVSYVNQVSVGADEPDPDPENNSVSTTTSVTGVACTIIGTPASDTITGTDGADRICGIGGDDTIHGGAGNDFIVGGAGNDSSSARTATTT